MDRERRSLKAAAVALCDMERFEEAAATLRESLRMEPADPETWSLLAYAELSAGRAAEALEAAHEAVRRAPGGITPHLVASIAALQLGRAEEAVSHGRAAVAIDPAEWRALVTTARALAASGRAEEARELAERAVALHPREPEVHFTAGVLAAVAGRTEDARGSFRYVLALDPGNASAQHELARLRLGRRTHDPAILAEAAAGFARALARDATRTDSRGTLDLVLRVFLSKTSYLLFLDAYLAGRLTAASDAAGARLLPVLLLGIPGWYAGRFIARSTDPVRREILSAARRDRSVRIAATLEALAVLCILAAAFASGSRAGLAGSAAAFALVARLLLYRQVERSSAVVHGTKARPMLGSASRWIVASALALMAGFLVLAAAQGKANSAAFLVAAVVAVGAVAVARSARRQRTNTGS